MVRRGKHKSELNRLKLEIHKLMIDMWCKCKIKCRTINCQNQTLKKQAYDFVEKIVAERHIGSLDMMNAAILYQALQQLKHEQDSREFEE